MFYQLVLSQADREWVDAFQLYQGDVDFHDEAFTFAAEKIVEWTERGFISEDSTGIPAEDMGVAFTNGEFPIMVSGSWWYGRFMNEITDFEWSTFLWPGNELHAGSGGNLWVVPANAKNKELAYDFIDITMSTEIQTLMGNEGGIPVNADLDQIEDPKIQELISNFNRIIEADGFAFYPDWPAPGYYDILVSGVQELIAGTMSPEEALDFLADPYFEYRETVTQ